MTDKELREEYLSHLHAVQSGIKVKIDLGDDFATSKHLRVGVDSAMVSDRALVSLLVAKGVFTEREYLESLVRAAREERTRTENELSERLGRKVTLA